MDIRAKAAERATYTAQQLRVRCLAAGRTCATQAGCTCHGLGGAYQTVSAPDQPPLETGAGDLSEHHEEPEGWCVSCTAVFLVAVGLAAGMLWFAAKQILKGAP